jgi:hypothetical protein
MRYGLSTDTGHEPHTGQGGGQTVALPANVAGSGDAKAFEIAYHSIPLILFRSFQPRYPKTSCMQDRFHGGESSGMFSYFTGRHHLGHFVFFNLSDAWEKTSESGP